MIPLSRPLVFFDLETTGVDVYNDRIIQIGAIRIKPDGAKTEKEWMVNPGIPIPKGASDIHGITDEMVADKPLLGDIAEELANFFTGVDFGGYNVKNFDLPLLSIEFGRIGLPFDTETVRIVDAMAIFRILEPRNLGAAYKKFCGKELVNAHNAMADIRASLDVFEGQIKKHPELPQTLEEIHELCFPKNPNAYDGEGKLLFVEGDLCINFGKNKGKTLAHLAMNDPGYLEWILNGTFSEKVKDAIKKALG
jgi:DNA polymerase-3 subunit epsilon